MHRAARDALTIQGLRDLPGNVDPLTPEGLEPGDQDTALHAAGLPSAPPPGQIELLLMRSMGPKVQTGFRKAKPDAPFSQRAGGDADGIVAAISSWRAADQVTGGDPAIPRLGPTRRF
jgi:hypothetical protein